MRGNDISFIFQEPMTSLNPLHTIEKQLAESLALHQGLLRALIALRALLHQLGRHAWPPFLIRSFCTRPTTPCGRYSVTTMNSAPRQ